MTSLTTIMILAKLRTRSWTQWLLFPRLLHKLHKLYTPQLLLLLQPMRRGEHSLLPAVRRVQWNLKVIRSLLRNLKTMREKRCLHLNLCHSFASAAFKFKLKRGLLLTRSKAVLSSAVAAAVGPNIKR